MSFSAFRKAVLVVAKRGHIDDALAMVMIFARMHHMHMCDVGDDKGITALDQPISDCYELMPVASVPRHGHYALTVKPTGRFVVCAQYIDEWDPVFWNPKIKDVCFQLDGLQRILLTRRQQREFYADEARWAAVHEKH